MAIRTICTLACFQSISTGTPHSLDSSNRSKILLFFSSTEPLECFKQRVFSAIELLQECRVESASELEALLTACRDRHFIGRQVVIASDLDFSHRNPPSTVKLETLLAKLSPQERISGMACR